MKRHPALVPLSRQHHDGLALGVFIERELRDDPDGSAARRLRQQALDAFDLELRGHFAVEEEILFPAVRAVLPEPAVVDELLADHVRLRKDFAALEGLDGEQLAEALLGLRERLTRHIRTEERVLFEAIQACLPAEELAALGQRIEERLPAVCAGRGAWERPPG